MQTEMAELADRIHEREKQVTYSLQDERLLKITENHNIPIIFKIWLLLSLLDDRLETLDGFLLCMFLIKVVFGC